MAHHACYGDSVRRARPGAACGPELSCSGVGGGLRRRLPVYLGAPNAATFAPPNSFINALEHTPRQLARLLRHLSADEEAYGAYFEWRGGEKQGDWVRHFTRAMHEHVAFGPRGDGLDWVCQLCKVHHKYYDWPEDTSTE